MWSTAQSVVFFLFHVDPVGDELFVEDVATQEEGMICLERFNCAPKRVGHAGDLGEFFRWQLVKIFVKGIAGVHAVLDSIEPRKKHRREGEVRICSGVRCAEFNTFCFWTW